MMDFRAGLLRYLSEQQLQAIEAQTIGIAGAGAGFAGGSTAFCYDTAK